MKKITKPLVMILLIIVLIIPTLAVSAEQVDTPPNATPKASADSSSSSSGSKVVTHKQMKSSINKKLEVNKDVKAWLYVPNTNMSMPVVQGKDNKYYEKRMLDGTNLPNNNYKNYQVTATYVDYRVKLGKTWDQSSNNIVVYGHNWNNLVNPLAIGNHSQYQMFAQLPSYTDAKFAKENPYIYFSTGDMEGVWKVFAVGYCEADSKVFAYNTPNISDKRMVELSNDWKQRSLLNFDVDINENDQIITMATCTRVYGKGVGAGQTFAVVARRLRSNENDTQAVTVAINPNVKEPSFTK